MFLRSCGLRLICGGLQNGNAAFSFKKADLQVG